MTGPIVKWTDELLVNIDEMDAQHRKLLEIINQLHAGLAEQGQDRNKVFSEAAKQCVWYVKEHFAKEEKLLLEKKYPGYPVQKKEHTIFVERLLADVERFDKGDRLAPNRFVNFLAEWLTTHIAAEDKKYSLFLAGKTAK